MTSTAAAARAVKTDAAARMKQDRGTTSTGAIWLPSTHALQPSAAQGKVQHPSTVCIRQDRTFVGSKTRTDAITTVDDVSTHRSVRIRMQTVECAAEKPCQQHAIE